jgi:hypothetical protein
VARADAVCADANSAAEKLGPRPGGDPALLARWWDDFSEVGSGALAEIRNLPPPGEDGDAVEAMLAGYERAYELAREHADALRAQDGLLAAELYGEGNNEVKKAHAAARELGFDDCSFLGVAR